MLFFGGRVKPRRQNRRDGEVWVLGIPDHALGS
jgi:hypothetical protein